MDHRYKIVVSNRNLYKEIELSEESTEVRVGTGIGCDVRLRKELFFGPVELLFVKNPQGWSLLCSDNLYLSIGDSRKLLTKDLYHGDTLKVRYQNSDNDVVDVEFLIDFDHGRKNYHRVIDISGVSNITIGGAANQHIVLTSRFIQNDAIELNLQNQSLILRILRSQYGIYHNGKKAENYEVIKNGDFFSINDYSFYYKNGKLWTEIRNDMQINYLSYSDYPMQNQYPKFNRNTRVKVVVNDEKIEVLDPPAKPQKPKNNLLLRLLPSMGMFIAAGIMAFFGGVMIVFSLVSGTMAVVTTVLNIRETNKDYKKDCADRIEKYNAYIDKKNQEIQQCRMEEQQTLEEIYIDQNTEQQRFNTFSPDLFDRSSEDEDFLCLRLGSGYVEAKREISYKKQERIEIDDELWEIPQQLYENYKYIPNAPVVCDLKAVNAVGIVGDESRRFEILKNIVVDITARHYFTDVKLAFIAREAHKDKVRWLRMLPHTYCEQIGTRLIVCDDESKNVIFEYLYKELTARAQNKAYDGHLVVFFYDEYGFKSHPVSKFIDKAKDLGVTFVFFGDTRADIPMGCGYVIEITDDDNGYLINTQDRQQTEGFIYPHIAGGQVKEIVKMLAPVYTEEISLESTLTKSISMYEMLGILAVDDLDLTARWAKSQVFKSMSAPIGVTKMGIISLDLHDKAHGPHGLVAGTTGAGKSEILQTYILSMATLFHPYEVGFVIIDFKGGGMVNQFRNLPHLLGAITNIDGKAINRSLKSIKAELQKRQRLFAEVDVNHIDKYIQKYKAGEATVPLPHLIIIVDEFAELKAEQPEFMKELISAARIGRSLGVHLILATQKPSGQVNEQIWSNSRFKLCLKVQSQEDSNEVIKSPLAAEIKEPGRAYLQVGNNEIFELFQSAYSGAPEKVDDGNVKEFAIYRLTDSGKRIPVFVQKKKSGSGGITQLDAIVNYVSEYCKNIHLNKLPDICLPALGDHIAFSAQAVKAGSTKIIADIGIYDDPENQYQGVFSVDLSSENLMMIGSAQSGKTNILQDIIRSLAVKYRPDEVSVYIIDFASMALRNYEKLAHVGGVVCPSEDEKLKNLFKLLNTEIETRKEKLIAAGVSSFTAYKEAGETDLPLLVLMIDNLTALKELYFQDDDELLNLCREGLSVGLSIVISNSQTAGIGYKYLSNFSARIAMFCNDVNEYSSLFDHCSERIDNIQGRCIVEMEKRHFECQSYLAFEGEKEIDRSLAIRAFIEDINSRNRHMAARRIPLIPASLTKEYMLKEFENDMQTPFTLVAGLDYGTVSPFGLDFASLGLLAVCGREKSGRHNWIKYSVDMMETMYPEKSSVYIVDGVGKNLASLKNEVNVSSYSMVAEDAANYIKDIEAQLKERYDALVAGDEQILDNAKLLMLVIDNPDGLNAICNDTAALAAYRNITGRYKHMKVCMIALVDNVMIPYSAPEILKNIRDQHHLMYFDDIANMKIYDVPLSMVRNFKKPVETGDAYYIRENTCVKLKTPFFAKRVKEIV
ncbi:MAG: type VII secretion protein EssC [Lachnospiraceae bacterium]|nr:type VII secretion protein EssC [Lachnospiraceae bacterium]